HGCRRHAGKYQKNTLAEAETMNMIQARQSLRHGSTQLAGRAAQRDTALVYRQVALPLSMPHQLSIPTWQAVSSSGLSGSMVTHRSEERRVGKERRARAPRGAQER